MLGFSSKAFFSVCRQIQVSCIAHSLGAYPQHLALKRLTSCISLIAVEFPAMRLLRSTRLYFLYMLGRLVSFCTHVQSQILRHHMPDRNVCVGTVKSPLRWRQLTEKKKGKINSTASSPHLHAAERAAHCVSGHSSPSRHGRT